MGTTSTPRWGQHRRLAFIDFRLQYEGRINRRDLIDFFGISVPQASSDFTAYAERAPGNLKYDSKERAYVVEKGFSPVYVRSTATSYLAEINGLELGTVDRDESFVGTVPSTGVVATPARLIEAREVAILTQAIRDSVALSAVYQSMDRPEPHQVLISPHALGFDGLRWHVRAWWHEGAQFRDFAIGRLLVLNKDEFSKKIDPTLDIGWSEKVPIVLVPHPGLSPDQRACVAKDYGMNNERYVLECRKAMLFYTLRHLNLSNPLQIGPAAQQHVVIQNAEDVVRWVKEDRDGNPSPS